MGLRTRGRVDFDEGSPNVSERDANYNADQRYDSNSDLPLSAGRACLVELSYFPDRVRSIPHLVGFWFTSGEHSRLLAGGAVKRAPTYQAVPQCRGIRDISACGEILCHELRKLAVNPTPARRHGSRCDTTERGTRVYREMIEKLSGGITQIHIASNIVRASHEPPHHRVEGRADPDGCDLDFEGVLPGIRSEELLRLQHLIYVSEKRVLVELSIVRIILLARGT